MKAIGFWPSEYDQMSALNFLVDSKIDEEKKEKIISYLDSGEELIAWLGYSSCRFRCGVPDNQMGSRDLTDGEFVWPEGFSHYIKAHNIALPPEFISHMERRNYNSKVSESGLILENLINEFYEHGFIMDASIWRKWLKLKGEQNILGGES